MRRRDLLLSALAAPVLVSTLAEARKGLQPPPLSPAPAPVMEAVEAFAAIDAGPEARKSCLVVRDGEGAEARPVWRAGYEPDARLFVGSAVKTFILAEFLRQAEAEKLSSRTEAVIDDSVRSLSSPVFLNLTGRTPYVSVLEAMIAHSDNTATDVAMAAVGPAQVRSLIKQAGLADTRIPDSTRALFGWLAGGASGVDPGWQKLQALAAGAEASETRSPMNDLQTMQSTARDLVAWYRSSLRGDWFGKPGTLREYKRILAMPDALSQAAPPDALAWGKGGSIDWGGFHCFALAGQTAIGRERVTFCFTLNWHGSDAETGRIFDAYRTSVRAALEAAAAPHPR